jgi:hypothetical protein
LLRNDLDMYFRQNSCLLTRIERVIHGLTDRREEGLGRIVEPQEMTVLGKKLTDGNVPLANGQIRSRASRFLFGDSLRTHVLPNDGETSSGRAPLAPPPSAPGIRRLVWRFELHLELFVATSLGPLARHFTSFPYP